MSLAALNQPAPCTIWSDVLHQCALSHLKHCPALAAARPAALVAISLLHAPLQVFFCKYNDPIYVKLEKLEIMIKLASERNIDQVKVQACLNDS